MLKLTLTVDMIDVVCAYMLIVSLLPAEGKFIANAIGKSLRLCEPAKKKQNTFDEKLAAELVTSIIITSNYRLNMDHRCPDKTQTRVLLFRLHIHNGP